MGSRHRLRLNSRVTFAISTAAARMIGRLRPIATIAPNLLRPSANPAAVNGVAAAIVQQHKKLELQQQPQRAEEPVPFEQPEKQAVPFKQALSAVVTLLQTGLLVGLTGLLYAQYVWSTERYSGLTKTVLASAKRLVGCYSLHHDWLRCHQQRGLHLL